MSYVQSRELDGTELDYSRDSTIAELFSQQVARTPDAIAVVSGSRQLSFRELDERTDRLAWLLQDLGVEPDTLVGVAMGRTETLVVSVLSILKAGGAYVPLDPSYPTERLSWIIEDSKISILLTTEETHLRINPGEPGRLTVVDAGDPNTARNCRQSIHSSASSRNLAYVIYTSGSTGKPKGVMIENRNVVNFFTGMDQALGCEPGVWLAVTSLSFDISVLELLWTLTRGFKVVIHGDEGTGTIADEITLHHVTHLQMTPSLARMLAFDARSLASLSPLKQLLLGGEEVPASLIHVLRQVFKGEIYNMYGPTETTIWSTTCRIRDVYDSVSIGRPISNTQIHILDSKFDPVPQGDAGELFIGGDGVARGYWSRPDLTAERFLRIPSITNQRLYRTGDMARYRKDGDIQFLGRVDFQIKLRGHRIEPGEIEATLEQCSGIRQAVVVLREDREGDKRLVAYLVADATWSGTIPALKSALESRLPDYMVPSSFVILPALPLTDNRKIDRKALLKLPPPNFSAGIVAEPGSESANELETIIATVWQEALDLPAVGINENFFDLGAHSLTVAEVHARLQEVLGREIALIDLFQFTTVSALAGHLTENHSHGSVSDRARRRTLARQR
jgi:amino acid adenylation domain-containing protein